MSFGFIAFPVSVWKVGEKGCTVSSLAILPGKGCLCFIFAMFLPVKGSHRECFTGGRLGKEGVQDLKQRDKEDITEVKCL